MPFKQLGEMHFLLPENHVKWAWNRNKCYSFEQYEEKYHRILNGKGMTSEWCTGAT